MNFKLSKYAEYTWYQRYDVLTSTFNSFILGPEEKIKVFTGTKHKRCLGIH